MISKLQRVRFCGNGGTAMSLSPAWTRWFVLTFALLFGAVSTAQAAHVHQPASVDHHLQGPLAGSPSADTEEHCPLCVAMHAALPAPMHIGVAPVLGDERCEGTLDEISAEMAWHFARFSRPPPPLA